MSNEAFDAGSSQSSAKNFTGKIDPNAILQRAKEVVLTPELSWPAIKAENTSIKDIYERYLVAAAAVPAISSWIGLSLVGQSFPVIGRVRQPFFSGLVSAAVSFAASLAALYAVAVVIEKLAPKFGAKTDVTNALKLAGYCALPAMLSGIFMIIPSLAFVAVAGTLASLYALYKGLPIVTEVPEEKKLAYFGSSLAALIVAGIIIGIIQYSIVGQPVPPVDPDLQNQIEEGLKTLQQIMPKP